MKSWSRDHSCESGVSDDLRHSAGFIQDVQLAQCILAEAQNPSWRRQTRPIGLFGNRSVRIAEAAYPALAQVSIEVLALQGRDSAAPVDIATGYGATLLVIVLQYGQREAGLVTSVCQKTM